MHHRKPSRLLLFSILLLSLTVLFASEVIDEDSALSASEVIDEDSDDIEELLALEEEADSHHSPDGGPPSGAQVLSRAQRIVLELNTENSKSAIEQNEYVMVLGYAPWCSRSAELMPRFAEAATALKEQGSPLLMAKIDGERYPKAASALGVSGFPTLLLFINGSSQSYTGGFTSEEILIWVKKKTGAPIIRVSSVVEANESVKKHSRFLVGLFPKFEGPEYDEFVKAAESDDEIQFIETSNLDVAKVLFPDVEQTKVFLGLSKSEPKRYTPYGGTVTTGGILQFLDDNKFPLVTILTELNSAKVYAITNKLQVFVFADAADLNKLAETLQDVARKFKSKIMLVLVDMREDNLAKPFLTLLGLEDSENAVATAFDYKTNSKYLLESDPTPTNIEEFCLGLSAGKWAPFYKSKPIPDNKNASILAVVGKSFDDLILSSPQNILLEVYTPWCIDCDRTAKQVEKLAKHFKGMEGLVFARIDASANEHPKLQVEDYPALLFYTAKDKQNPIKFSTKSSSKELATLINKSLKEQDEVTKDEL